VRGGPHNLIVGEHASPTKGHVGADEELLLVARRRGLRSPAESAAVRAIRQPGGPAAGFSPEKDQAPGVTSRLTSIISGVVGSIPGGSFGTTWPSNQACHASRDSHTSMTRYPELVAPLR
jgi:hypothetical protein